MKPYLVIMSRTTVKSIISLKDHDLGSYRIFVNLVDFALHGTFQERVLEVKLSSRIIIYICNLKRVQYRELSVVLVLHAYRNGTKLGSQRTHSVYYYLWLVANKHIVIFSFIVYSV
jgi:hypothetical protein